MSQPRLHYWQRHTDGSGSWSKDGPPPGAELAALRRGIGREAGSVPAMWPFYTTLNASGGLTRKLRAEHIALTLFAVHQQSQSQPVYRARVGDAPCHSPGFGLGSAMLALRHSGKYSPDALDRRFAAAATAISINELSQHLRGLITQLHGVHPQPGLDYTELYHDLRAWQYLGGPSRVRRKWGASYFVWEYRADPNAAKPASS